MLFHMIHISCNFVCYQNIFLSMDVQNFAGNLILSLEEMEMEFLIPSVDRVKY